MSSVLCLKYWFLILGRKSRECLLQGGSYTWRNMVMANVTERLLCHLQVAWKPDQPPCGYWHWHQPDPPWGAKWGLLDVGRVIAQRGMSSVTPLSSVKESEWWMALLTSTGSRCCWILYHREWSVTILRTWGWPILPFSVTLTYIIIM